MNKPITYQIEAYQEERYHYPILITDSINDIGKLLIRSE